MISGKIVLRVIPSSLVGAVALVCLSVSFSASAQEKGTAAAEAAPSDSGPSESDPSDSGPSDEAPPEEIEFVDEGPSPFDTQEEELDLPEQELLDRTPPSIDDFAVAAGSPDAAVRVTAVVTDDASGIEAVEIFYKVGDQREFSRATLEPQTGGLFMGILPDGPQRTGFSYYAQAKDAAGNVTTLGDPEAPYKVKGAVESDLARLARSRHVVEKERLIAPIWIAVALGVGVIGVAGGALFAFDFSRLWFVLLPQETAGSERHTQIQQLAFGDAIIGSILAVFGAAGLITGTGLLIYAAIEE